MESGGFTYIGIVFAMDIEMRGLTKVLSQSRRVQSKHPDHIAWQLGRLRIMATVSGMGRGNAAAATNVLIDAGARRIINGGLAAALDGKAEVGDVVVVRDVQMADEPDSPITCDVGLGQAIPPSGSLGYSVWQSNLVTTDRMILDPEEKRLIYAATGAAALDMECYAAAKVCATRRVPFSSIKSVSDTASEALPKELVDLADVRGKLPLGWYLLRRPELWRRLWRLRKSALSASDNLGDALAMMLLRLSRG